MRFYTFLGFVLSAFMLGCAAPTPTPFQAASPNSDFGYRETALTDTQYRIDFVGNRHTQASQIKDYAMLRAAQLTLQQGYDWFVILDSQTDRESKTRTDVNAPLRSQAVVRECGVLGCASYVTPVYSGVGIRTYEVDGKVSTSLQISMGKGQPEDRNRAFDAEKLAENLAKKS